MLSIRSLPLPKNQKIRHLIIELVLLGIIPVIFCNVWD
jgi:hypothetical protein